MFVLFVIFLLCLVYFSSGIVIPLMGRWVRGVGSCLICFSLVSGLCAVF